MNCGVIDDWSVDLVLRLVAGHPGAGRAGLEGAPTCPDVGFAVCHRDDDRLAVGDGDGDGYHQGY